MIVGTMKAQNVDQIRVTLDLTMELREWRLLADQLQMMYPSWELAEMIREMARKAETAWQGRVVRNEGGPIPPAACPPDPSKGKVK